MTISLRITTFGLSRDFQWVAGDELSPTFRTEWDANFQLIASVTSEVPSISSLRLVVSGDLYGIDNATGQAAIRPFGQNNVDSAQPDRAAREVTSLVNIPSIVQPWQSTGLTIRNVRGKVHAVATDNAGVEVEVEMSFRVEGPDRLLVGCFNLWGDSGSHDDAERVALGAVIRRRRMDIVCLQEAVPEWAGTIAQAAGLPYVAATRGNDVAILSRWPISDVVPITINPGPGRLDSRLSNILSTRITIAGLEHQVIGNHWGIRDANDVIFDRFTSAPGRLSAAQKVTSLLSDDLYYDVPAIVLGDFNAVPTTDEMKHLLRWLRDSWSESGAHVDQRCDYNPIDFVLMRGLITCAAYNGCMKWDYVSNHPLIWTWLEP